jgi:hypothetical protein
MGSGSDPLGRPGMTAENWWSFHQHDIDASLAHPGIAGAGLADRLLLDGGRIDPVLLQLVVHHLRPSLGEPLIGDGAAGGAGPAFDAYCLGADRAFAAAVAMIPLASSVTRALNSSK